MLVSIIQEIQLQIALFFFCLRYSDILHDSLVLLQRNASPAKKSALGTELRTFSVVRLRHFFFEQQLHLTVIWKLLRYMLRENLPESNA